MYFDDRTDAGTQLAEKLKVYRDSEVVVLALPRGGVPVAYEVAKELEVPLGVLVVKKICSPLHPELGLGAICENARPWWNTPLLKSLGINTSDLEQEVAKQRERALHQVEIFRSGRALPSVKGKIAIIVDDGIATGATVYAAIDFVKKLGAQQIVVAVPVAAKDTLNAVQKIADEVIAIYTPEDFASVGRWYLNFRQVEEIEVLKILKEHQHNEHKVETKKIKINLTAVKLDAVISLLSNPKALIVFVHGSGSNHRSPRNRMVAEQLQEAGYSTLLFDLLTTEEALDRRNIFDIKLLSSRLYAVLKWCVRQEEVKSLPIGLFTSSTGTAAGLSVLPFCDDINVFGLVSRGGRPDIAEVNMGDVHQPVLLIVGGYDADVLRINHVAVDQLPQGELKVIEKATHLFEEAGALEQVAQMATHWFNQKLWSKDFKQTQNIKSKMGVRWL